MVDTFISTAFTLPGLAAVALIGGLLWLSVTTQAGKWFQLSLILFCVTLDDAKALDQEMNDATVPQRLVSPLQELREYGRPLTLTLLVLSAVVVLGTRSRAGYRIPFPSGAFAAAHGALIAKMLASGMNEYAGVAILAHGLWLIVYSRGVQQWLASPEDIVWCVRTIGMMVAIFCLANLWQFSVNRNTLFIGQRFTGTTANPQFAGVLFALSLPFVVFLAANHRLTAYERGVWIALASSQVFLLLLTGSRAGTAMSLIGISIAFRGRLGRFVLLLPLTVVVVMQISKEFSHDIDINFLVRTEDTRSDMWAGLLWNFENHPLIGAPQTSGRLGFAENSWLSMASVCGIVGLIPLIVFGVVLVHEAIIVSHVAPQDNVLSGLGEVLQAVVVIVMLGSIFEPYLLGIFNFPVPLIYVCIELLVSLRRRAAAADRG